MTIRYRSGSRISTLMALNAAIWTFLSFMFMFQLNAYFHASIASRITWFIVGISLGIFFSTLITRKQLDKLEKKGEAATTLKTIFITIGIAVVAIVAFLEVSTSNLPRAVESAFAYSVIACAPASFLTRTVLLFYWERRNKTTIFQDKFGLYVPTKKPVDRIGDQSVSNQTIQIGTGEVKN